MSDLCKSVAMASGYAAIFILTAAVPTVAVAEPAATQVAAPPAVQGSTATTVGKPVDPTCKLFPHLCVPPVRKVAAPPAVQGPTTPKSNVKQNLDSGFIRRHLGPSAVDAKPSQGVTGAPPTGGEIPPDTKPNKGVTKDRDASVQPDPGN